MNRKTLRVLAIFELILSVLIMINGYGLYCTDGGLCAAVYIDKSDIIFGMAGLLMSIFFIVHTSEGKEK